MAYIDKEKLRMHIILRRNSLLKTHLSDEEKEKFLRILDEVGETGEIGGSKE